MLRYATSNDISIEVNGKKLAAAQSYRARTDRDSKYIEAFGSREPVGCIGGKPRYLIELSRVTAANPAVGDGVLFHELSDFNVVIVRPDRKIIYSGCEWSRIDETGTLGSAVLESASIVASGRMEHAL